MHLIQQVLFILVLAGAVGLFAKKVRQVGKLINLGKPDEPVTNVKKRWRNVLLYAFGQKKLFRNPLVGVLHFFIYAGFIIINLEILEIIIDGIAGTHRIFEKPMGEAYQWLIDAFEVLAVLVLASCVVFLLRRNVVRVKRLNTSDLNGWPKRDANIILITEIILMALFLTMDATDGGFLLSKYIPVGQMAALGRTCWWLHIVGVLAFMNYLPYSKHFHIILGFPNTYYASIDPPGEMENMPNVQKEVEYVFHPENAPTAAETQHFGARDIEDLKRSQLLQAYSCTECGRCTAACPANQTGKKLSPRKIMMDTRDRMEQLNRNKDDKQTLLHGYITPEELRACTTCNACVQECPVSISPLSIILELRRALVMEESSAPPEWNSMFSNIENNFAPWKFSPEDRGAWAQNP